MKRLMIVGILILVAGSLLAFDWGGYLDNTTGYASVAPGGAPVEGLVQTTTGALWLRLPLGSWTLDAQGSLRWTPVDAPVLLADLDRLTIGTDVVATEAGATTFGFSAGRSNYRDATGYVLNHTLDGIKLRVNLARAAFRFDAATTALVQKPANSIVLSKQDQLELSGTALPDDFHYELNTDTVFAPARLIANFEYRMLEALAGQHVTVAATLQEDLRPQAELTPVGYETEDPRADGRIDTQYVTLGLAGPLAPGLFHSTYYTLNSGRRLEYVPDESAGAGSSYQYQAILAHMAGLELTYFIPQVLNSRARLFGQFSTGESDWSDAFVPIAPSGYSDVFTLQPGNSAHLGVSYSLRPLAALGIDVLQSELRSVTYFRSTGSGRVSEPAVDSAGSGAYVGSDINLVLTAVPLSDLRVVLKGGAFVPNPQVMSPDNKTVDYQVTLQGVLRF